MTETSVEDSSVEMLARPYQVWSIVLVVSCATDNIDYFGLIPGGAAGKGEEEEHHRVPRHRQRQDLHRRDADEAHAGEAGPRAEGSLRGEQRGLAGAAGRGVQGQHRAPHPQVLLPRHLPMALACVPPSPPWS